MPSHQVGTGTASVAQEVADVQKLLKASGLLYSMHSAGTTIGKSLLGVIATDLPSRARA